MLPGCVMGGVGFQLRIREKCCESEERVNYARKQCVCARAHARVCVGGGDSHGVTVVGICVFQRGDASNAGTWSSVPTCLKLRPPAGGRCPRGQRSRVLASLGLC